MRDPVCGMHVAEVLSIPLREGGELVHFCSPACRDEYVNVTQGWRQTDSSEISNQGIVEDWFNFS